MNADRIREENNAEEPVLVTEACKKVKSGIDKIENYLETLSMVREEQAIMALYDQTCKIIQDANSRIKARQTSKDKETFNRRINSN